MRVKIFEGSGRDGIVRMEAQINEWLKGLGSSVNVLQMSTAASSVKDPNGDEIYQHLVVTFLCR